LQVPPRTLTTALLAVKEEEYDSHFQVKSYFCGRIAVKLYNKKKGNSLLAMLDDEVFRALEGGDTGLDISPSGKVFYTTDGTCTFHYAIQHSMELKEEPLPAADESTNGQEDAGDKSSQ